MDEQAILSLAFLYRHSKSELFPEITKELFMLFGEGKLERLAMDAERAVQNALNSRVKEGAFTEFAALGLTNWEDIEQLEGYLRKRFGWTSRQPQHHAIVGESTIKHFLHHNERDLVELSTFDERPDSLALCKIGYGYRFSGKPAVQKEIVHQLKRRPDFHKARLQEEMEFIKELTANVKSNAEHALFNYGVYLNKLGQKLGLRSDAHFEKEPGFKPRDLGDFVLKAENPSYMIQDEKESKHIKAEHIKKIETGEPFPNIRVLQGTQTVLDIAYGINMKGKYGFDAEKPQFTQLEARLDAEGFARIKQPLITILGDILTQKENPVTFHVADAYVKAWLEGFIQHRMHKGEDEAINLGLKVKDSKDKSTLLEELAGANKAHNGSRVQDTPLGTPEKYALFLKAVSQAGMPRAQEVHDWIMEYSRERSPSAQKARKTLIQQKKAAVERLLREHQHAKVKALEALEAEKKANGARIVNPSYRLTGYEETISALGAIRLPNEKQHEDIWKGMPFYKVARYTKQLSDICLILWLTDVVSYRLYPGSKNR